MIRAVYRNGVIYPAEPVPEDWSDGQPLNVETGDIHPSDDRESIDEWERACRANPPEFELGEFEEMRELLAEADAAAKSIVRRQMESAG